MIKLFRRKPKAESMIALSQQVNHIHIKEAHHEKIISHCSVDRNYRNGDNGKSGNSGFLQLSEDLNIIQIYETDDLTAEILENRNGNIIIEKTIGQVLNENGDGIVLNTDDDYYNYISYRYVEGAQTGDIILTYFIYNPDTSYIDDIMDRFDYIIDRPE